MVNIKKNVLTQKQAKEENVGSYHHPTNKTWRSGACVIGEELRKGYYRKGYVTKTGKIVDPIYVNTSCAKSSKDGRLIKNNIPNNKLRKEILTEKQSLEKPIGSYYHPSENTWRSGACPEGEILKKGYKRKSYKTKTGKIVPEKYIDPICIKDKGSKGKTITNSLQNNNKKNNNTTNDKNMNKNIIKKNKKDTKNNNTSSTSSKNNIKNNNITNNNITNNNNKKLINNLYKNIKQPKINELTTNMIIQLIRKNKL